MRIRFIDGERVEGIIDPVQPEHRGGLGTEALNGGVLAAIFDLAIGCTSALVDPTRRSATVQLSMSFQRPTLGDRVRVEGRVDHAATSTIFSSARLYDAAGNECAKCQGVVRIGRVPWSSGGSPAVN
jgi:uncharacterized protein (TIGR00369 family)